MSAMFTREQLIAEKSRRDALRASHAMNPEPQVDGFTREQLLAEKARRDALRARNSAEAFEEQALSDVANKARGEAEEATEGFNWPKFIVEQVGTGVLSLPDLLQAAVQLPHMLAAGAVAKKNNTELQKGVDYMPAISERVFSEPEEPETGLQRIAGHVLRGTGAALTLPFGGPVSAAGMGATQGALSGTAQEFGANPVAADILSGIGVGGIAGAASNARRSASQGGIATIDAERKVADYLQKTLGPEGVEQSVSALKNPHQYSHIQYEPMTAEIAGTHNPLFPQLHRLRYETVGSGLPSRSAAQREAIGTAFENHTLDAATSNQIQQGLKDALAKRKGIRHAETNPLYEQVNQMTQEINPIHTKAYLDSYKAKGDLLTDKNYIQKAIQREGGVDPSYQSYANDYFKLSPEMQAKVPHPQNIYPEARELSAAKSALNDKAQQFKRSGESQRKLKIDEARIALEKDLDAVPIHKEASNKYREFSRPVNEITDHKVLTKVMKSKADDITGLIFGENYGDNVRGLRKALSDNPNLFSAVKQSGIQHLERSITNSGAEGSRNVLSYTKFRRYMDKHKNALGELLDDSQIEFLNELGTALHGQNVAKSLGKGEGSPTYSRLASDLGLRGGLGMKGAEMATKIIPSKLGGGPLRLMLRRYMQNKESDVMSVLDRVLQEPDYATNLLESNFRTQRNFNQYLQRSIAPTANYVRSSDDEEES